jgi:hypothetical protein
MTINQEDAARLRLAAQKRCDAAYQQICGDIHAMVVADALNEEWREVANRHRERCDTLVGEMERIAAERDRLMQRVMELEQQLKQPRQGTPDGPGATIATE